MDRRTFVKAIPALPVLANTSGSYAQAPAEAVGTLQPIVLPKPDKDGGKSVLAALQERRTNRNVSADKLSPQLW